MPPSPTETTETFQLSLPSHLGVPDTVPGLGNTATSTLESSATPPVGVVAYPDSSMSSDQVPSSAICEKGTEPKPVGSATSMAFISTSALSSTPPVKSQCCFGDTQVAPAPPQHVSVWSRS